MFTCVASWFTLRSWTIAADVSKHIHWSLCKVKSKFYAGLWWSEIMPNGCIFKRNQMKKATFGDMRPRGHFALCVGVALAPNDNQNKSCLQRSVAHMHIDTYVHMYTEMLSYNNRNILFVTVSPNDVNVMVRWSWHSASGGTAIQPTTYFA